jgi:hypothetical protein
MESDFARTPAPPASAAGEEAEPRRAKMQLGNEFQSQAGQAGRAADPLPLKPFQEKAELQNRSAPAPAQQTNGYLGVSAQIDANAAILESVRSRAAISAGQGNAIQGNFIPQNSLHSSGRNQNFYRFGSQRGAEDSPSRKLRESVNEDLFESKRVGSKQRQQVPQLQEQTPQSLSSGAVADETRSVEAGTVVNPQQVPSPEEDLVRALIILKPEPPKPAGPPAPAEAASKKAGD